LNTDILDSKGLRDINLDTGEFINTVEIKPQTEVAQSNNNQTNVQLNSENQNEEPKGYDVDSMFNVLMGEQENSIDVNNSEEGIESNKRIFRKGSETQEPLALQDDVLTTALDKEVIKEMKTSYVTACEEGLAMIEDNEEITTAICKCLFGSIMDAELIEEDLQMSQMDAKYYYPDNTEKQKEWFLENWNINTFIGDIEMNSMGVCMLETNYFNYLYDLPIKE